METTKYEDIINSVINGNWSYSRDKVKFWSKAEKRNLLDVSTELGRKDDIIKLLFMD